MMIRRAAFLALAAMALFAVQAADCSSLFAADQHHMSCCGSMPCHSSHAANQCCKMDGSRQAPPAIAQDAGAGKISLAASALVAAIAQAPQAGTIRSEFEAPRHSPPELYALHSSLRI